MKDVFSLSVEECFLIENMGVVVIGTFSGNIQVGTIIYDLDGNAFTVRGIDMPRYSSFEKTIRNECLSMLLYSDKFDAEHLKSFLQGKQLKSK